MAAYVRFLLRTRFVWLFLILAATVVAAWSLSRGRVATSVGATLLGESEKYIRYRDHRIPQFGSDAQIIVGIEAPDIFSPPTREALAAAVADLERIPEVVRVQSALDAVRITSTGETLSVARYGTVARDDPEHARQLARELAEDPLSGGYYLSRDGRSTSVVIEIQFDDERPSEETPALLARIEGVFRTHGLAAGGVYMAGMPVVLSEVMLQTMSSIDRQLPLAAGLLLLIVFLLFGRLWPVLICGAVGLLSSLWTMGLAVAYDRNISVLMAMVPSVIVTVCCSDVIHLASAYLLELSHGHEKRSAIIRAGEEVGRASAFTALTALAGFTSLSLIPTPVFRELGLVLGFGVCAALLLSLTLGPILFSLMPVPKPWTAPGTLSGFSSRIMDRVLTGIESLSSRRPWHVIAVFAALLAWSAWCLADIRIDTDLSGRLPPDNPLRVAQARFEESFLGSSSLEIFVDTGTPGGALDPKLLQEVAALDRRIEQLPSVARAMSLPDILGVMQGHLAGSGPPLPETREQVAQHTLLLESSGPDSAIDAFVDFDRASLRLVVLLPEQGVRKTYELGETIQQMAEPLRKLGATVEAGGSGYLAGAWLDDILVGQLQGLGASLLVVVVMMIIALRSLGLGLWAMVPNLLPLVALGGYVALRWPTVDSDVLAVFIMADGIAVDDTIHFLTRYRVEAERTSDPSVAMRRAYHFSGRAVVITALVLVAGFAPFALSDYLPIEMMGALMPLTLFLALICELFLVPAMVRIGVLRVPMGTTKCLQEPQPRQ